MKMNVVIQYKTNRILPLISLLILVFVFLSTSKIIAQSKLSFDIYTQEEGLPNNQIQCIFQDSKGWMWIGTSQGLSRFDGYNFANYLPNPENPTSISGNLVRAIKEDSHGNLLVGTETGGLNIFNKTTETFSHPLKTIPGFNYKEIDVNDVIEDSHGNLWLATDLNLFILDTLKQLKPIQITNNEDGINLEGNYIRKIQFDNDNNLWLGTIQGVFIYNPTEKKLSSFELPFADNQNREILELYLDDEGLIWIGTYSMGAFIVDPKTKETKKVSLNPTINRTETVRSISKGIFGEYWIGTRGGLFKYSKTTGEVSLFRHDIQSPRSLSNNSVLSIYHDLKGETWIGTRGGLNLLAKSKQVFHNFSALPGDNKYMNSNIVYCFWIDNEENIWIGTEDGGINIYNPETKTYKYLTANANKSNTISQNCIKSFLYDGDGNLWVGTFLGGIDVINLASGKITNYSHNPEKKGSLSNNNVWDMCLDQMGNIWVVTSKGINQFDKASKTFIHHTQLAGDDQVLWIEPHSNGNLWIGASDEVIIYNPITKATTRHYEHSRSMFEDSQKKIWIATNDNGIALYTRENGAVKYYNESLGLANNQTLRILEDNKNNLWISTSNGLSKFNPKTEIFQNFTRNDGLGNNQFCYGASYKTKTGELLFGTISGFNIFPPEAITPVDPDVPLVFTDLKIFNKSVQIGEGKKPTLKKSISETDHLILNHKQNFFTLEFAALNYVNSENNLYSYKLEGFNDEWIGPGKQRTAPFTNLNPGNYTLKIKQVHHGNLAESKGLQLSITILPPFWKTNWFLAIIYVLILTIVYAIIRFFVTREKIKSQLVIEKVNARKLHELDMMKLKFFTNISHEIRTPLTLILGPLEKMLKTNLPKEEINTNLNLMHRNAKNLDRLISQLLDFRKLQTGNLKLNTTEGDIVGFLSNIVSSFSGLAEEKEIKLTFNTLKKRLFVSFDPDKIEKIINNLLSNAFKFTDSKGSISVNLSLIFDSDDNDFSNDEEKQFIEISIKDTGKGISNKNIDRIFLRFFQSEEKDKSSGAGIGLALVKDLIKLHNGTILVTSKPNKGTKFTIRIPYILNEKSSDETTEPISETETPSTLQKVEEDKQLTNPNSKVMLIVEDNADVRQFIQSHFKALYKIYEATDGEEGWNTALETIPDVIVSDIIMPNVDGYELCKRIKNDERTSHIPIILLTAMHSKEHELKGLTKGADDYITKPFDLSVLQAKVENILSIRDSLMEKYTSTVTLEPTNKVIASPDEKFLQRVVNVVEENISDSELDIENFAIKVGISRMQLYRKLNALTNMTVKEFIRHIRLKRATQLLKQQNLNISEIAYEVGFRDLSHFRKCFKREYGMSATEYLAKLRKEQ